MKTEDRALLIKLSASEAAGLTAYLEARNQPILGVAAVVFTIRNRANHGGKGKTWQEVAFWPKQYSCWNSSDPNYTRGVQLGQQMLQIRPLRNIELEACLAVAEYIQRADRIKSAYVDPTGGAMHYYAVSIPKPAWAGEPARLSCKIGDHAFYTGVAL